MPVGDVVAKVLALCPRAEGRFVLTSPATRRYNCHAWTAGETHRRWYPDGLPDDETVWWPLVASGEGLALDVFERAFATLGYEATDEDTLEDEWEKIALFVDDDGDVVHSCRQLADGRWTSKLGTLEDIAHDAPLALAGGEYGVPARVMRRRRV